MDTDGGVFLGADARGVWERLFEQIGHDRHPVIMPSKAVPEAIEGGGQLVEINASRTSADRPPNFLGLREIPGFVSRGYGTYIDRQARDRWLDQRGFYDALEGDGKARDWRINAFVAGLRGSDWKKLKGRYDPAAKSFAAMHRDLSAWWTDLTDDDREYFWDHHCDHKKQTTLAKVTDPRHENADARIPPGMEKLTAKGWTLHEYQKKAVNFVVDHAPRALLAMEMGLGKTLVACTIYHEMKARGDVDQALIAAPLSAHGSWADHFGDLSDARVAVMGGWPKAKRHAAYAAFDRGELDVLVVSTDTPRVVTKKYAKMSDAVDPRVKRVTIERDMFSDSGRKTGTEKTFVSRGPAVAEWYRHPGVISDPAWDALARTGDRHVSLANLEAAPVGAIVQAGWGRDTDFEFQKTQDGTWRKLKQDGGGPYKKPVYVTALDSMNAVVARGPVDLAFTEAVTANKETRILYEDPASDKAILEAIMARKGKRTLRVADEVHKYKNPNSARSKGFWDVITKPEGPVIGMTGTPKPNGVEDFYHVVNNISPGALGKTYAEFSERYSYRYRDRGADKVAGLRPEKLGQLYEDAASVMFVRTTSDPDSKIHLPGRTDLNPVIPPSSFQQAVTEAFPRWVGVRAEIRRQENLEEKDSPRFNAFLLSQKREELKNALAGGEGGVQQVAAAGAHTNAQTMLLRAQQLAISPSLVSPEWGAANPTYESPKTAAVADAYVEHMTQQPNTGGVIFCTFNKGISEMRRALLRRGISADQIVEYTGATPTKKRQEIQRQLNSGAIKVVLGNTKALETGANFQKRANFVAHLNTPWEPAVLTQSTARVYRQGQENPVTVLRPVGSDAEALIERVVSRKLMEAGQVTGKTMDADKAVADTVRGEKLDADTIARILGINPADFGEEKQSASLQAELARQHEKS